MASGDTYIVVWRVEGSDGKGPWYTRDPQKSYRTHESWDVVQSTPAWYDLFQGRFTSHHRAGCRELSDVVRYFEPVWDAMRHLRIAAYRVPRECVEYSYRDAQVCFDSRRADLVVRFPISEVEVAQ